MRVLVEFLANRSVTIGIHDHVEGLHPLLRAEPVRRVIDRRALLAESQRSGARSADDTIIQFAHVSALANPDEAFAGNPLVERFEVIAGMILS